MQVQVYTLRGQKLLNEILSTHQANQISLSERLANGVYLYRVVVRNKEGLVQRSELKKLLIQR
jgi:hypothetical protein